MSDIYEQFFDEQLEWVAGQLPKTFKTCSAFLSQEEIELSQMAKALNEIHITL